MALSEREQQVLRDLEKQLGAEDPGLAQTMTAADKRLGRPTPRRIGAGIALVLGGFAVVVAGVAIAHDLWSVLVGLVGFALAVWGSPSCLPAPPAPLTSRPHPPAAAGAAGVARTGLAHVLCSVRLSAGSIVATTEPPASGACASTSTPKAPGPGAASAAPWTASDVAPRGRALDPAPWTVFCRAGAHLPGPRPAPGRGRRPPGRTGAHWGLPPDAVGCARCGRKEERCTP